MAKRSDDRIHRAAVGRRAIIGDLYDARRDQFLVKNRYGFSGPLEEEYSTETDCSRQNADYIKTNSVREEFEKLGIEEELGLSIACGLVEISGSAAYHDRELNRANSQQLTLAYTKYTKYEEVDGVKRLISRRCLDSNEATHVVIGITWGVRCNITGQYTGNAKEEEEGQVNVRLEAEMDRLKAALLSENNGEAENPQQGENDNTEFTYCIYCDLTNLQRDASQSFRDTMDSVMSLPDLVSRLNDGKGIPISYTMISLNLLRKWFKMKSRSDTTTWQTEENTVKLCYQIFQSMRDSRQKINTILYDFKKMNNAVASHDFNSATRVSTEFYEQEETWKSTLSAALVCSRSGSYQGLSIEEVWNEFLSSGYSTEQIDEKLTRYEYAMQKIKLITEFEQSDVLYIGNEENPANAVFRCTVNRVYVFNMDYTKQFTAADEWRKEKELFSRLVTAYKTDNEVKFVIIDLDFQGRQTGEQSTCIGYYDRGNLRFKDLLKEAGDLYKCIIKTNVIEQLKQKPVKRIPFEITCPLSLKQKCSEEERQWVCKECGDVVEYGREDKFLYCTCGKSSAYDATFRCNDIMHGIEFTEFDPNTIEEFLSSMEDVKETTILLLGETRVGKSTWINAIANYMAFESLKEAKDSKNMKILIPCKAKYVSKRGDSMIVQVGTETENENMGIGEHGTLRPKEYKFCTKNYIISFIDTPGIGDDRVTDQDKENVEDILSFLGCYNEINAICILLSAHNPRLTDRFIYCIRTILDSLHRSAANNIIFCFTRSKVTQYKPGDTYWILKKLLGEYAENVNTSYPHNQFYFDNEAFNFLAICQTGNTEIEEDFDSYSESWDISVRETQRLLGYIDSLSPHMIQNTVSIYRARRIILELSQPLATIVENIQRNGENLRFHSEQLKASQTKAKNLKDQLNVKIVKSVPVKLPKPMTVCTDESCVKYVKVRS